MFLEVKSRKVKGKKEMNLKNEPKFMKGTKQQRNKGTPLLAFARKQRGVAGFCKTNPISTG
jgi:hypothetical protein